MRVEIRCDCGAFYVIGEDEPFGEGFLPGSLTSATCSECHPELDRRPQSLINEKTAEADALVKILEPQ